MPVRARVRVRIKVLGAATEDTPESIAKLNQWDFWLFMYIAAHIWPAMAKRSVGSVDWWLATYGAAVGGWCYRRDAAVARQPSAFLYEPRPGVRGSQKGSAYVPGASLVSDARCGLAKHEPSEVKNFPSST